MNTRLTLLVAGFLLACSSGCTALPALEQIRDRHARVEVGMTADEVSAELGAPSRVSRRNDLWTYEAFVWPDGDFRLLGPGMLVAYPAVIATELVVTLGSFGLAHVTKTTKDFVGVVTFRLRFDREGRVDWVSPLKMKGEWKKRLRWRPGWIWDPV